METEKLKLQVPETQMYVIKTKRHPIGFTAKSRASDTGELVRKLSNDDGDGRKATGLD